MIAGAAVAISQYIKIPLAEAYAFVTMDGSQFVLVDILPGRNDIKYIKSSVLSIRRRLV